MNKLIIIILFLICFIQSAFSQNVAEIGMSENELLVFNNDICLIDTLDDGTKFIKAMLVDKENFIYYFLNDSNQCFCVVLYFNNMNDINKFSDTLSLNYDRNDNKWHSRNDNVYIHLKNIDLGLPLFFIWNKEVMMPKKWEYHN